MLQNLLCSHAFFARYMAKLPSKSAILWQYILYFVCEKEALLLCLQVPCRPPVNIQAKVLDASGSYIRFVLLQVHSPSHVLR